jgi:ABC-type methionine transport system ATPase subunit
MATRRVKLTFPGDLIKEPVIYQLGHKFPIETNVRRADVTAEYGWVILEVRGEDAEINRALAWATEIGVRIDPVGGDLIEG